MIKECLPWKIQTSSLGQRAIPIKSMHSALKRNLMKVWKTWTGPSLGDRAWSRGPKSALSKILQNKEHFR